MALQSIQPGQVLQMAQAFRARAAEAEMENTVYHRLMLRTAVELEDLAGRLKRTGGTELMLADDEAGS